MSRSARSLRYAVAVAIALLGLPVGEAVAKTQVWKVEAVAGEYTMTGNATHPVSCETADEEYHGTQQVLAGRYHVAFRQVEGTTPTPVEYRNYLRGPGTWGGGSAMRFDVERSAHEDFRYLDTGEYGPCEQRDQSCDLAPKRDKRKSWIAVTTRRQRVRVTLHIIGDTTLVEGCHDDDGDALEPEYSDDSGQFTPFIRTSMPIKQWRRRVVTVRFKGSRAVRRARTQYNVTHAFEGRLSWSATVRLRKSVISKACAERGRPTGFVCSN